MRRTQLYGYLPQPGCSGRPAGCVYGGWTFVITPKSCNWKIPIFFSIPLDTIQKLVDESPSENTLLEIVFFLKHETNCASMVNGLEAGVSPVKPVDRNILWTNHFRSMYQLMLIGGERIEWSSYFRILNNKLKLLKTEEDVWTICLDTMSSGLNNRRL